MKTKIIIIIVVLLGIGVALYMRSQPEGQSTTANTPSSAPTPTPTPTPAPEVKPITVTTPQPNEIVSSPLTVTGQAPGTWYFEASFPVKLLDATGKVLAQAPAQAQGEWMTENFVPFKVTLTFPKPATATGTLVLEKDNPSGLPENDDQVTIPIKFQ